MSRVQSVFVEIQIVWDTEKQLKTFDPFSHVFFNSAQRADDSLCGFFCLRARLITLFGFKNESTPCEVCPCTCDHLSCPETDDFSTLVKPEPEKALFSPNSC